MWLTRYIVLGCLLMLLTGTAHASSEKLCRELYRLSYFLRASHCYEQLARSKRGPLNVVHKIEVGLWLTNAARNLSKAAAKEKDPAKAALYRERAATLCQEYLTRKLHDTPSSKKRVESMLLRLKSSIGYATLTVSSGNPKTSIEVTGYKYKRKVRENFMERLRPGTYKIDAMYPGAQKTTRVVTLSPNIVTLVRLGPTRRLRPTRPKPPIRRPNNRKKPIPRRYPPVWPHIVTASGGAAAVTGAVLLGVGFGKTQQERDQLAQTGDKTDPVITRKIGQLDANTRFQTTSGFVFLGAGIAVAVTGVIVSVLLSKPPTRPKTAGAPQGPVLATWQ